ncbi:MAG: site-2 protease family protein [Solirubrobacterales bacterium]|nr:site-2 protease family protein [Solirubrobacterales bacterium]
MFGAGNAITLMRIAGIRITVDWSWFLILFLIIFWLSDFYGSVLGRSGADTEAYLLAVASAVGFFGSILLHELGHAVIARRNGIGINMIRLWIFGGVAEMDREANRPGVEFRVAVAGPLVTLAIAVILAAIGIWSVGSGPFRDAIEMQGSAPVSGPLAMVAWLTAINILVLGFNLLPAYPMDGGRIVRSIAWKVTGKRSSATRFAARLGQVFAYLFMGLGLLLAVNGNVFNGVWLLLIGFIINGSARAAATQTTVTDRLEGVTVADVMDHSPVLLPADLTVERALEEYFLRYGWSWFPLADAAGHFGGMVRRERLEEIPAVERAGITVGELADSESKACAVTQDSELEVLLGNPHIRRFGALMVTDPAGKLSGVITIEQLGRALQPR